MHYDYSYVRQGYIRHIFVHAALGVCVKTLMRLFQIDS